jgi:uncharacterized protein (TIGR02147 family)
VGLFLKGKRPLPDAEFGKLVTLLGLNGDEADFLRALDDVRRARSRAGEQHAVGRVAALRRRSKTSTIERRQMDLMEAWYNPVIRETWMTAEAPDTAEGIVEALEPEISVAEAERALERLEQMDIQEANLSTGPADLDQIGAEVQRQMLQLAVSAIRRLAPDEREFQAFTAKTSRKGVERFRIEIRETIYRWMETCETDDGPPDRVVQVGCYLFPVARWDP